MAISFYKMHGAANDFILVDDRKGIFPVDDNDWIAHICARNTGIGSEGVLLIQESEHADFRMRFFNPDGNEVDMCGNGARCIARLAGELGVVQGKMAFETPAGIVRAEIKEKDIVLLHMTPPGNWRMDQTLNLDGNTLQYHFVNTGVPHVVVPLEESLGEVDVVGWGREIRNNDAFAPDGTNVNFMQVTGPHSIYVRTYERGVEAETPACGTGIVACGLVAGRLGLSSVPVKAVSAGGHELEVGFELVDGEADQVTLTGPAEHVFHGKINHPSG